MDIDTYHAMVFHVSANYCECHKNLYYFYTKSSANKPVMPGPFLSMLEVNKEYFHCRKIEVSYK